jgi:phosphoribosylanthranilate isomerase
MRTIETSFVLKICGITSADDARAAVEAGANALGFNFYRKSSRYVTPEHAHAIAAEVAGDYLRVGVFVNAPLTELIATAEAVPLDVLQLHGDSDEIPAGTHYRIWRSLSGETASVHPDPRIEAYLLDTATPDFGGSGKTFRWELAAGFKQRAIVAGGLDASNVASAIAALQPWGVDACSRLESQPGKKDQRRMRDFIQAARRAADEQKMVSL